MKTETVPIVIGTVAPVRKGKDNFIENKPGKINFQIAQKVATNLEDLHEPLQMSRENMILSNNYTETV